MQVLRWWMAIALGAACTAKESQEPARGLDTAHPNSETDLDPEADPDPEADLDPEADTGPDPYPDADRSNGEVLFLASCGGDTCHGADGSAGPATNLPNVIPFFNDPQLKSIITNGIGYMPPVGYTGTDLTDVVAYLRTTFP